MDNKKLYNIYNRKHLSEQLNSEKKIDLLVHFIDTFL